MAESIRIDRATEPETDTEGGPAQSPGEPTTEALIDMELLVEDVAIDGMCGVY